MPGTLGRRFFIFPEMSLSESETSELRLKLMTQAGRSVILVPNDAKAEIVRKEIADTIGFKTYSAEDIGVISPNPRKFLNHFESIS